MRLASFPSPAAFLRWCMLLVLGMAGGFAPAQALTNGNFESPYVAPTIDGWLKTQFLNFGLVGATPYNGTSISRAAGGNDLTNIVNAPGGAETQVDPNLGAGESLRWPKFGNQCVLINSGGNNRNGNSVKQTFTLDSSMVDPADGRLHIRFAFAPVLENPGHSTNQQPFFNINVKDVTQANVILYDNLNFSNQPGSPWKTVGGIVYTDWQVKDIALDPAVYLNDTINIEFTAAGCALGGHFGKLYVDGIAAVIPGLWVSVSADRTTVPVGGTIRYTYTVRNTGVAPQTNVIVDATAPVNTTVVPGSLIDPGGLLTPGGFPAANNIGTLAPGAAYTFSVDVTVNGGTPAGAEITSGNYYAKADLYGALYGSPVKAYVAGAGTDLAASMAAAAGASACNTQFTVTITNNGPATASQAVASLPLPANTNLVSATTTMGLVTGANPVVASLGDMASGASATFTVVVRPKTTASVPGTVTVSGNFVDTVPANDQSTAAYANLSGGPAVSITTQPVGGTFYPGSTPSMTVAAANGCGALTYQWYLNGVAIGGATTTGYTTPALAIGTYNYSVQVMEASGYYVFSNVAVVTVRNPIVTVPAPANGGLDPSTPSPVSVAPGNSATFTFNANLGYHVTSVSGCSGPLYTNTSNAVASYTYTTGPINGDCTVTATFAINMYTLQYLPTPNGYLTGNTFQTVAYGGNGTPVTAQGTLGSTYRFFSWSDGVAGPPPAPGAIRQDLNVTSDISATANFATLDEEPNNNYIQATRVSNPGLVMGRILLSNDLDYYRIVLPRGGTFTATLMPLTPPGGLSYFVYIYDQAGKIVAQSTLSGGQVNTAAVRNNGFAPYYYYAVVRAPWGFSNPNYYQLYLNW